MAFNTNRVVIDLSPGIKILEDGTIERLCLSSLVPPSPEGDLATGASSKDIAISPEVSARLYLPKQRTPEDQKRRHPIMVYFHGGGFVYESAFMAFYHDYMNILASEAGTLAVSVEYRLAPEHPLPAAYEDCWAALKWVASHGYNDNTDTTAATEEEKAEPWLTNHGDFSRIFINGDSAGGNIAHNIAMRASTEKLPNNVSIHGAILAFPYFWGSKPTGSMSIESHMESRLTRLWLFAHPSAPGGIDSPMINPMANDAPSLAELGCCRLLVCVGEEDALRERGLQYVEAVKRSGWGGEVELLDVDGEGHCFQILNPHSQKATDFIKRVVSFIVR